MNCTTSTLSPSQKADLLTFVSNGGKLIIYDSECVAGVGVDYSWLPFPFTTNNPGPQGATGTLNIVEENILSLSNMSAPHFIDAAALGSLTDAVGDMNVMVTRDQNWCLDMSGTNTNGATGPVHTYAQFGAGLIIYNGLDVDFLDFGDPPNGLTKIWIQELQVPLSPTQVELPCLIPVIGINLEPETDTNQVGLDHTVTATLTDLVGSPQVGTEVTFAVTSGPNVGASGTCTPNADCTTDAAGQVSFTYTGTGEAGTDQIEACFLDPTQGELCDQATKDWTPIPVGISLTPESDTNEVGQDHTVTATLTDDLVVPQPGFEVTFAVTSGPNVGASGTCTPNADCTTDAAGQVSFTYTGTGGAGTDQIEACFLDPTQGELCDQATKDWTPIPVGISLTPESDTNEVGQDHTVPATLTDDLAVPQPGFEVTFAVTSGPNVGASGTCTPNADCTTDAAGRVSFTYTGTGGAGTDQIEACFLDPTQGELCDQATKDWITPTGDEALAVDCDAVVPGIQKTNADCSFAVDTKFGAGARDQRRCRLRGLSNEAALGRCVAGVPAHD